MQAIERNFNIMNNVGAYIKIRKKSTMDNVPE